MPSAALQMLGRNVVGAIAAVVTALFTCAEVSDGAPPSPVPEAVVAPAEVVPSVDMPPPIEPPPVVEVTEREVEVAIDSPTRVIQRYMDELRAMVPSSKEAAQTPDPEREQKIAEKVRQFFDFKTLARMSLGRHWLTITAAQQGEFSELFIVLIESSYLSRTKDILGDFKIVYGAEHIDGNRAKVTTRVARDDADIEIVYELHRSPTYWMIFNIILDGVDLIRNYQSQFNRIITRESFQGLLSRMRKKKDEKEVSL